MVSRASILWLVGLLAVACTSPGPEGSGTTDSATDVASDSGAGVADAGTETSADAPDAGDEDAPDTDDEDAPDAGDEDAPDTDDEDAPDAGDEDAPEGDVSDEDAPDAGDEDAPEGDVSDDDGDAPDADGDDVPDSPGDAADGDDDVRDSGGDVADSTGDAAPDGGGDAADSGGEDVSGDAAPDGGGDAPDSGGEDVTGDVVPDVGGDAADSGDAVPDGGSEDVPGDTVPDGGSEDVPGDTVPDGGGEDAPDASDVPVADADAEVDVPDPGGVLGDPCLEHGDCLSGICVGVDGDAVGVCSSICDDVIECPAEFECVRLDADGEGGPRGCLPDAFCFDLDDDEHGVGPGCTGWDCDESDPDVNASAAEDCNGVDDDCDGDTDEDTVGAPLSRGCYDGDIGLVGVGVCVLGYQDCVDEAWSPCTDQVLATAEVCDGLDNDCDGDPDEGLTLVAYYPDDDGDTYGSDTAEPVHECARPDGHVENADDCDDSEGAVRPGAHELIGDGVDQNCDGAEICFVDVDDDGFRPDGGGAVISTDADCDDLGEAREDQPAGDCNDRQPTAHPGSAEVCDGLDNDCNVRVDDGAGCYATGFPCLVPEDCATGLCEDGSCVAPVTCVEDGSCPQRLAASSSGGRRSSPNFVIEVSGTLGPAAPVLESPRFRLTVGTGPYLTDP